MSPLGTLLPLTLSYLVATIVASSQDECPAAANPFVESGWQAYRAEEMNRANAAFIAAQARCRDHIGARTGLGYVALRRGQVDLAAQQFDGVLADDADVIDALIGRALVAWRRDERAAAAETFRRVQDLEPENAVARQYLELLSDQAPPPERPPLVLPDSLVYRSRTNGDRFETRGTGGWEPFYVKGVNLGAALPGKHPSEFPDSVTYASWLSDMAAMGANVVRLYTVHPPHFYQALSAYNRAHPDTPLWLIHGVWTELPPQDDYDDPAWQAEFFGEMRAVVDLLHGRADISIRPGHAGGYYTADVSPWVLAYIIGREWEPFSAVRYIREHPEVTEWSGRYLEVEGGNALDVWMAKACEEMVAYETATYRAQHPIAYTNWPTLDPLYHPTEAVVDEELAIRRARGEPIYHRPLELENDAVGLDASLVGSTSAFPAGYFASYHVYPYYPDFMVLDPGYGQATSSGSGGPSNYFGYLTDLKRHHTDIPVLIAEYGVPASLGSAHLSPQGWHHGGHDEETMAVINARMTREIAEANMAGGILFAWIDEWFKKNWLVVDFEIPLERNRLWLNRFDAEQHYGVIAMEPESRVPGHTLDERLVSWRSVPPLLDGGHMRARAVGDEAYLWLLLEGELVGGAEELFVGFDIYDRDAGAFRWPEAQGPRIGAGVEFVLRATDDSVRLVAEPGSNPFLVLPTAVPTDNGKAAVTLGVKAPPPGLFAGRWANDYRPRYLTQASEDGRYDRLLVVTNRRRFGRDSVEYLAVGYDRGMLPGGGPPDGLWERAPGVLEIRLPWQLINVTDPSERRVLQDTVPRGYLGPPFGTVTVQDIGIAVALRDKAGTWRQWPLARFAWPIWETPRWTARRRPVFEAMWEVWSDSGTVGQRDRQ